MSLEASGALTIYRHLLKAIRKHIGVDGTKAHFKDYVTGEFRKNLNLNDPEIAKHKLKLARDYTYLVNSVQHHKVCGLASNQYLNIGGLNLCFLNLRWIKSIKFSTVNQLYQLKNASFDMLLSYAENMNHFKFQLEDNVCILVTTIRNKITLLRPTAILLICIYLAIKLMHVFMVNACV